MMDNQRPPPHNENAEPNEAKDMAAAKPEGDMPPGIAAPPTPTDVIPVGDVETMVENLNDAGAYLIEDWTALPKPVPEDAKRGIGGTRKPLDPIVWHSLLGVAALIAAVAEKVPSMQALIIDPSAVTTSAGVKDVANKLAQVSMNEEAKKAAADIIEQVKAQMGGEAPAGGAPPPQAPPPAPPAA